MVLSSFEAELHSGQAHTQIGRPRFIDATMLDRLLLPGPSLHYPRSRRYRDP